MLTTRQRAPLATLLLLIWLVGCGRQAGFDEAAFERIEAGMSAEQVTGLLGKPNSHQRIWLGPLGGLGGLVSAEALWHYDDRSVIVRFLNGQVTIKQVLPPSAP